MDWGRMLMWFLMFTESVSLAYYYHQMNKPTVWQTNEQQTESEKYESSIFYGDMLDVNETHFRRYRVFVSYDVVCKTNETCEVDNYDTLYYDETERDKTQSYFWSIIEGYNCLLERSKNKEEIFRSSTLVRFREKKIRSEVDTEIDDIFLEKQEQESMFPWVLEIVKKQIKYEIAVAVAIVIICTVAFFHTRKQQLEKTPPLLTTPSSTNAPPPSDNDLKLKKRNRKINNDETTKENDQHVFVQQDAPIDNKDLNV